MKYKVHIFEIFRPKKGLLHKSNSPRVAWRGRSPSNSNPQGWLCYPEDVANAVAFFVLPESDFITGEAMNVAGGANLV